jgi:hypothetical protein
VHSRPFVHRTTVLDLTSGQRLSLSHTNRRTVVDATLTDDRAPLQERRPFEVFEQDPKKDLRIVFFVDCGLYSCIVTVPPQCCRFSKGLEMPQGHRVFSEIATTFSVDLDDRQSTEVIERKSCSLTTTMPCAYR